MNIAAIIFLVLAILSLLIAIFLSTFKHDPGFMIISIMSLLFGIFSALVNFPSPIDADVRDGKAIIVEEKHVGTNQSGDTIYNYSTYHMEWLPEWKYGRKHD